MSCLKMKTFPCPSCTAKGQPSSYPGDCVDVSSGDEGPWMMQIAADEVCFLCEGKGFIEVGSIAHWAIKCQSVTNHLVKTFDLMELVDDPNIWLDINEHLCKLYSAIEPIWKKAKEPEE